MRHSPTGSDQGRQSQVLVISSLNRSREGKVRNQAWGLSMGVRSSRRQDWKQGYYGDLRAIQGAGLETGLNTGTLMVSLGSAITGSWAHRQSRGWAGTVSPGDALRIRKIRRLLWAWLMFFPWERCSDFPNLILQRGKYNDFYFIYNSSCSFLDLSTIAIYFLCIIICVYICPLSFSHFLNICLWHHQNQDTDLVVWSGAPTAYYLIWSSEQQRIFTFYSILFSL